VRPFLKNRLSALTAWLKRHPLIGTALALFLVYVVYEFCTTFLVICRDAYVTADIVAVAPKVSGPMLRLAVTDNQSVASGDLLFTIDPQPYQIELDREKAALALAQANLSGAKDRLALAQNKAGVAFILAIVTGNNPPDTIGPVIGRIAGMTGGVLVVGSVCFVLKAWPSAARMSNSGRPANDQ
jgi:hypothetical protein